MKRTYRTIDGAQPVQRRMVQGEDRVAVSGTACSLHGESIHLQSCKDGIHSISTTDPETFQSSSVDPTANSCLTSSSHTASPTLSSPTAVTGASASRPTSETYSHNNQIGMQISYSDLHSGVTSRGHYESPSIKQEDDSRDDAVRVAAEFECMFDYGKYDKDKDMQVRFSERSDSLCYIRRRSIESSSATMVYPCGNGSCGMAFLRQSELKKHRRVHFERSERPYPCSNCDMAFLWPKDLERHRRSRHTDQSERFHCHVKGCQYFTQGFHRRDKLLRHLKTKHPTSCSGEVVSMKGQRLEQSLEDHFRYDQTSQVAAGSTSRPSSLDHSIAVTGCESLDASYLIVPSTQFGFEFAPELWKTSNSDAFKGGVAPWATHTQDSKCVASLHLSEDLQDLWGDGQCPLTREM